MLGVYGRVTVNQIKGKEMQQQPTAFNFREPSKEDCAHFVLLADVATRRLTSFLWEQMAAPGQSAFEIGRNIIINNENDFIHFKNWLVLEHQEQLVGALNGYIIQEPSSLAKQSLDVLKPLNELKTIAAGTWYISAAAVYPEHQGKGLGKRLLAEAENIARAACRDRMTLMVGSFNPRAYDLYTRTGFREWSRRPFVAFPGSDEPGEWILMVKDLK